MQTPRPKKSSSCPKFSWCSANAKLLLSLLSLVIVSIGSEAQTNYLRFKSFGASDAAYPQAPLIQGSDGVFYGTTAHGGIADNGTIFKLKKDGSGYAILWLFASGNVAAARRPV